MEQVIAEYHLTRYGRVRFAFAVASALLIAAGLCLYGSLWTVLLLLAGGLSYCCTAFLCFHPEGQPWREEVGRLYEGLFRYLLRRASHDSQGVSAVNSVINGEGGRAQISQLCHKEAQKFIQLILRDFVAEWYENVTDDPEFPEDVHKILEHLALETSVRLQGIDLDNAVCELLTLILPYLEAGQEAGTLDYDGMKVFDINHRECLRAFENNPQVAHRALRSPEAEARYYRQVVDTLLQSALPPEYKNCDIACMFVREVLITNIIVPLVDLISDPDFLNEAIPVILSKASPEKIKRELTEIRRENEQLKRELSREKLRMMHQPAQTQRRRFSTSLSSSRYSRSDLGRLPRAASDFGLMRSTATVASTPSFPVTSTRRPRRATLDVPPTYDIPSGHSTLENGATRSVRTSSASSDELESSGGLIYIQMPPIFVTRHVRISKDDSMHIGYIFKFPKWMLTSDELRELNSHESDMHLEGVKRYSEFVKFHNALLKSPVSIYIKEVELPERRGLATLVTKLPFTSPDLDPTILLERRQGLEQYLQSVSSIKEVAESELFRQFLKSGVKWLKEAHTINLHKSLPRRKTFLAKVKGQSTDDAEEFYPRRPMEPLLCSYLNTHLPLPCRSLHTPDRIHPRPPPPHLPTVQEAPTATTTSASGSGDGVADGGAANTSLAAGAKAANLSPESSVNSTVLSQDRGAMALEHESLHSVASGDFGDEEDSDLSPSDNITNSEPWKDVAALGAVLSLGTDQGSPLGPHHGGDGLSPHDPKANGKAIDQQSDWTSQSQTLASNPEIPVSRADCLKAHLANFLSKLQHFVAYIVYTIGLALAGTTLQTTVKLTKQQAKVIPLTNALFSLGTEVSRLHCPGLWATGGHTQLALMTLVGGGVERFLWKELREVVYCEESWARALYHLRLTLWPGGKLETSPRRQRTKEERKENMRAAATAFKKFLPNFFPYIVGPVQYKKAVRHSIECLQNPRINRHVLLRVVDVLLTKLVPELSSKGFQRQLAQMRTMPPASSSRRRVAHSLP